MLDTLDLFSPALMAAAAAGQNHPDDRDNGSRTRAVKQAARMQMRRAKSEIELATLLPASYTPGESWHVISHGDIDSLSYLTHALAGVSHFDIVVISTWCMARADIDQISAWLDSGRIDQLEFYVGEIFPNQYGDEYARLLEMAAIYGCRVTVARNHSKVMLMGNIADDYWLATESSANVNTNPRIEQTAVHASRELYDFYLEFFRGLKSIDRRSAAQ